MIVFWPQAAKRARVGLEEPQRTTQTNANGIQRLLEAAETKAQLIARMKYHAKRKKTQSGRDP